MIYSRVRQRISKPTAQCLSFLLLLLILPILKCRSHSLHSFFYYTIYQQFKRRNAMKGSNLQLIVDTPPTHPPNSLQIETSKSRHIQIGHQKSQRRGSRQYNIQQQESRDSKSKDYTEFLLEREVEIQMPQLIKEGLLTSYKLYKIKTKKNTSESFDSIVNRRFNDFQFLHHQIIDSYGGYVLPKLPKKNFLANLNLQTQEFVEIRTKELEKYLQRLLNHSKVRWSDELRHFLFDQQFDFSFNKGEFSEQNTALDGLKSLTTSVYDLTLSVYSRIVGKRDRKYEFSKDNDEEVELKLFEREVEDLIKVTKDISSIINQSYEQFNLVHQLSITSNTSHISNQAFQQKYLMVYQELIQEFDEIADFIESCRDAIDRTKTLRASIQDLEDQQAVIELKQRQNPRNRELDIIRSKIQKANTKSQKWIHSLKKQLSVYTNEGKTLMQHFVKKFTQLKGEIYSIVEG